jgi:hypothetical protein
LGPAAGVLQVSEVWAWSGVSVEVHEKPNELPVQPTTLESALQLLVPWLKPTQQYREAPLLPAAGVLQLSAELPSDGESVDEHEKPYEPPVQPATLASGAQLLLAVVVTQQ